jgi:mono/diheme cytochrome c family protein
MNIRRNGLLWIAVVVLCLMPLLAACQQEKEGPEDSVLIQDPHYIMGSGLYKRHCAGCHGEQGEGRTSLGPQINTEEWQAGITDEEIREVILTGRRVAGTSMDSFEGVLSEEEIEAVIVYVRTLRE